MDAGQNESEWVPTEAQAAVLEAAQEPGFRRTKTAIADQAGVPRTTLHRWLKDDPDFRRAYEDIWRVALKSHMPAIIAAQVEKALEGDTRATEFLAKIAGILKDQLELTGKRGGVVIMLPPEDPPEAAEPPALPEVSGG